MPQNKTNTIQTRLRLSQQNFTWLENMETKGIDKNTLVNIALDMLQPRIENLGATPEGIEETAKNYLFDTSKF